MMGKFSLIKKIYKDLEIAETILNDLFEIYYDGKNKQNFIINLKQIDNFMRNLSSMSNKHMPAKLCSHLKLMERSDEITSFIEEISLFLSEVKT